MPDEDDGSYPVDQLEYEPSTDELADPYMSYPLDQLEYESIPEPEADAPAIIEP